MPITVSCAALIASGSSRAAGAESASTAAEGSRIGYLQAKGGATGRPGSHCPRLAAGPGRAGRRGWSERGLTGPAGFSGLDLVAQIERVLAGHLLPGGL